jgi:hypothetical protein
MVASRKSFPFLSIFFLAVATGLWAGCGDDGAGPEEEQTGAMLMGQVISVGASNQTGGIDVSMGTKSTTTSGNGSFTLNHIPLGDHGVTFSGSGVTGTYTLSGVEAGSSFNLQDIQLNVGQVSTKHTGTWVGTAGSDDPGSQGQIAFTLVIQANGNALTGEGSVEPPDNSVWSMSGTENGTAVTGEMTLVSSNSSCATGGTFTGTFSADTLNGSFVEVDPPAGCGTPETGSFRVVKQ